MSVPRTRTGFTLMEVIVASVIVVMLAAATLPSLMTFLDRQRVQATVAVLQTLSGGIVTGATDGFYNHVHSAGAGVGNQIYPGLLHDLSNVIVAGTSADHNSCGSAAANRYNAHEVTDWTNNGPFVTMAISAAGISTPIGVILDSIKRDTIVGTQYLSLLINNVLFDDARTLDRLVDGGDSASAGTIRWGAFSGNYVNVKYEIPISSTHC